jgi:predicted MPP superfamily phosphohydrolase
MSVLLQLSDPHFGTEQAPMVKALAALAQQQPDLLVLSGDITQRAKRNQFAVARAFTDRLGAPLLAILGNHDIPLFDLGQRLFHPYARYREAFGNELEPIHASRDLLVQCVNTTRGYGHKGGTESSAQIKRVAIRLRRRARSTAGGVGCSTRSMTALWNSVGNSVSIT